MRSSWHACAGYVAYPFDASNGAGDDSRQGSAISTAGAAMVYVVLEGDARTVADGSVAVVVGGVGHRAVPPTGIEQRRIVDLASREGGKQGEQKQQVETHGGIVPKARDQEGVNRIDGGASMQRCGHDASNETHRGISWCGERWMDGFLGAGVHAKHVSCDRSTIACLAYAHGVAPRWQLAGPWKVRSVAVDPGAGSGAAVGIGAKGPAVRGIQIDR